VELQSGKTGRFGEAFQRFGRFVDDYADLFDGRRKGGDDRSRGFGCHVARAWSEDEAQGVSSGVERGARVIEIGGGADLDPEHSG